jgi:CubicO group peptidase (beta-lactamase class C family)
MRDVERDLPTTVDTPFYIASITKTVLATAVPQPVEGRKLELDASAQTYRPRFALADAAATAPVTVCDPLSHAQGINRFPIVFLDAYSGEITEDRYYHFPVRASPRGKTAYSNVHPTLAGLIVEAVSGKPWRDYPYDEVFVPAGMSVTTGHADEMYARDDVAHRPGTFALAREGGEPHARFGDLRPTPRSTGVDRFDIVLARGMDGPARFDVQSAAVIDIGECEVRFERA